MTKPALRKYYQEKRLALSDSERNRLDDLLLIRFQQWDIPLHISIVLSFWPLRHRVEPNTFLFTDFMSFRMPGMVLAYPVSDFENHSMQALMVDDDTDYKVNQYGIAEPVSGEPVAPEEIDLVLVPMLAFDRKGYRLGYGKGFYDRFLLRCRPDVVKLGFCYFDPVEEMPGIDQYDVPLNACITPDRIYEF